jgi:hypothetical protein
LFVLYNGSRHKAAAALILSGRPGRPIAGYPGYGWRGAAYGVAAGAAVAGAYGLYNYYNNSNNGCYYDTCGHWACPNSQYPYYR